MQSIKGETQTFRTVTVTDSQAVGRPDGSTALVLWTQEAGPIAFALDFRAIEVMRRQLAQAEEMLRRPFGSA